MERRESQKVVSVDGKNYQLNKLDARDGCWLFSYIGAKCPTTGKLNEALGSLERQKFIEIQNLVLSNTMFLDNQSETVFPTAVLLNGKITQEDLRNDSEKLMRLTYEALSFNIEPFLVESGSK